MVDAEQDSVGCDIQTSMERTRGNGCGGGCARQPRILLGPQVLVEDQVKSVAVVSEPGCLHQTLAKGGLYEMKHR